MGRKVRPREIQRGHRWFAATYDPLNWWGERALLRRLRPLVVGRATGRVLEIGVGTGANFPYYREAESVVATDPDPFMLRRAQNRAREMGLAIEFYQCPAEALPFSDASFDTVVSALTLCTVGDPARSLAEVRRVLKPGGAFRFLEHVRAEGRVMALLQDRLTPLWRWLGAGCHLNRRSAASIQAAGFEIVEMERQKVPLTPMIIGVAQPRG
jgi:ubiquinone/menaquinone biosynthesis C-methylase UbiE